MVRDREAWHAAVHRVARSWTWLGNWTTTPPKYLLAGHFFSSFMPSNHSPHFSQNKILKIQLWSFFSYWNFSNDLWLEVQSLKQFVSHIINQLMPYLSPFGSHTIRPIRLNSIILGNPACFFSLSSHCADYSHCEVWTKHWMKQG